MPLLHLHTQANAALPWSEIDMDFMNLNQAAHGDREFGYIQTRLGVARKTVVGHVSDPSVAARIGAWQRAARGHAAIRRLKLARFGDNMRDVAVTEGDKVDAEIRFGVSVNTWGVNDLVAAVDAASDAEVDDLVQEYGDLYDVVPDLAVGGERHESLRYGARIEAGLRHFLTDGGFGAFTTNFQDLGGLRQLPGLAVQRLMAEGYGFGGEGDWKTSVMLHTIKAIGAGQPGGTSFMEDYTYDLTGDKHKILGAHMLEVCPTIAGDRPRVEIHPLGIGDREDPVRLVFTAASGPAIRARHLRPWRPVPAGRQRGRRRPAGRAVAQAPRGPRRLATAAQPGYLGRVLAHRWRTAPHCPLPGRRHRGTDRLRRHDQHRTADHRRRHRPAQLRQRDPLERRGLPPRPASMTVAGPLHRSSAPSDLTETRSEAAESLRGGSECPVALQR